MKRLYILAATTLLGGCGTSGPDTSGPDDPSMSTNDGGGTSDSPTMMKPITMDGETADTGTGTPEVDAEIDTGAPPCVYPPGPYGMTGMQGSWKGMVVPKTFQWQGYRIGTSSVQTLTVEDLYDCDGRKNINAILFVSSALWCGACKGEAQKLPTWIQTWQALGVRVVELIVEDLAYKPATPAAALWWRDTFKLSQIADVVADPKFSFTHSGTNGLPTNILVNPRTMKVEKAGEGAPSQMDPAVAALANMNK